VPLCPIGLTGAAEETELVFSHGQRGRRLSALPMLGACLTERIPLGRAGVRRKPLNICCALSADQSQRSTQERCAGRAPFIVQQFEIGPAAEVIDERVEVGSRPAGWCGFSTPCGTVVLA